MSAMFDDWAYSSVYEPPSPPQALKPELDSPVTKRARAVSLVKSVAAHSAVVPEPELRPRAHTSAADALRNLSLDGIKNELRSAFESNSGNSFVTPLTKAEHAARWNRRKWLGHHSPETLEFNENIWSAKLVQYHSVLQEAELGVRLATEAKTTAHDMVREVDWLLHELRDTREHELEPMRAAQQRVKGLHEQEETVKSVRSALDTAWDSQDRIMRTLHGPAPRAVPKLVEIMAQVDAGLQFCAQHPDFLDIEATAVGWRSCAQRALEIAAAYCAHELRKVSQRTAARISENAGGSSGPSAGGGGARHALIYTKFAADTARLRPVVALLRAHAQPPSNQPTSSAPNGAGAPPITGGFSGITYEQYWIDLQSIYFGLRSDLLGNETNRFVEPLVPFTSLSDEFIDVLRDALVQFRHLYASEQRLFESLFTSPTAEFWAWLNDVSDPLYAQMRRLIVHETDISRLGQLILLVHGESGSHGDVLGSTSAGVPGGVPGGVSDGVPGHVSGRVPSRVLDSVSDSVPDSVLHGVNEDLRLRPGSGDGDLGNPSGVNADSSSKLALGGVVDQVSSPLDAIYKDAQNRLVFRANLIVDNLSRYEPSPKDMMRSQYPTVKQTLTLLGQVYELLNTRVFNDLAHRCVRECLASLDMAVANKVASTSGSDVLRVHLFHVQQLLTLQSQIVDFDLQRTVVQEVDFSGLQRLMLLRDPAGSVKTRSFRDLLALAWDSVPQVVEIMFDAMEELYGSLRRSVDRMCSSFVSQVFVPLKSLDASSSKASASTTTSAAEFRDLLATELKELETAISEYIHNSEVATFLLDSVQDAVMDKYAFYYRSLPTEELSNESLMDVDTMASWLSSAIADTRRAL